MTDEKYKVLVVEDQAMPRQLFEHFIETSSHFTLAGSIASAAFTEVYCLSRPINLILMDVITEGGENGLDEAEKIKKKFPKIKIIIVTSMPECSYIERAKKIGIEGFWYKETNEQPIIELMEKSHERRDHLPYRFTHCKDWIDRQFQIYEKRVGSPALCDRRFFKYRNIRKIECFTRRHQKPYRRYASKDRLPFPHTTRCQSQRIRHCHPEQR